MATIHGNDSDIVPSGTGQPDGTHGAGGDDARSGGAMTRGDGPGTWSFQVFDRNFSSANGQAFTFPGPGSTLRAEGVTTDFNVDRLVNSARGTNGNPDDFGILLRTGYVAPASGSFRFALTSDDGSTMEILDSAGNPVIWSNQSTGQAGLGYLNNDFHQPATTRGGEVTLQEGQSYTIVIRTWENAGKQVLAATVQNPGATSARSLAGDPNITGAFGGSDSMPGGAGNDTMAGEGGDDTMSGGAGNDSLSGGSGNDILSGDTGDDTLSGDAGADTLSGGDGADALYGGEGADRLSGGNSGDTISGGAGDDTAAGDAGSDSLSGDAGADSLLGGQGADMIAGGADNDTAFGGSEGDSIDGGGGDDSLSGDAGADSLYGGDGDDTLDGGSEGDLLEGGAGADRLTGGAGADTLHGGDDRDLFLGGTAGDVIEGGEGGDDHDTLDLNVMGLGKANTNILYAGGDNEAGTVEILDADGRVAGNFTFAGIETIVPCFTRGTLISTAAGDVPVEGLRPGDLVLTRDAGFRPLSWVGGRDVPAAMLAAEPTLRPVIIAAGALGDGLPLTDLTVSPQHRVLFTGARAEVLFGEHEVLVPAIHLVGRPGIARGRAGAGIGYLHILFDRHEVVRSNGAWTESFQPADRTLGALDAAQRDELARIFPEMRGLGGFGAARRSLKAHEALVLLG